LLIYDQLNLDLYFIQGNKLISIIFSNFSEEEDGEGEEEEEGDD
jgi:hypothetical protein